MITVSYSIPSIFILFGVIYAVLSLIAHFFAPPPPREGFWMYNMISGIVIVIFGLGLLLLGYFAQTS